jgi:HEPN domain-containing protein
MLPAKILRQIQQQLLGMDAFKSDDKLRNFFSHPQLSPWQYSLPPANSVQKRIHFVISSLLNMNNTQHENALALLLHILAQSASTPEKAHTLSELAETVRQVTLKSEIVECQRELEKLGKMVQLGKENPEYAKRRESELRTHLAFCEKALQEPGFSSLRQSMPDSSSYPEQITSPVQILRQLQQQLVDLPAFHSDDKLRDVFSDPQIASWQYSIPQAESIRERIDAVIPYLLKQHNRQHENALVLLLRVLAQSAPTAEKAQSLVELAGKVRQMALRNQIVEYNHKLEQLINTVQRNMVNPEYATKSESELRVHLARYEEELQSLDSLLLE